VGSTPPRSRGGAARRGPLLPHVVAGALKQALPERVMAEGSANIWGIQVAGKGLDGEPFTYIFFSSGGTGAHPTIERKALRENSGGTPVLRERDRLEGYAGRRPRATTPPSAKSRIPRRHVGDIGSCPTG
jgi:hypothetical protein